MQGDLVKKLFVAVLLSLAFGAAAYAQDASGNQFFAWNQTAPVLADAQAYTYKYYPDGSSTGVTFTGVVCTGTTSPFTCTAAIPAFTPGNHSITLTAANAAGESVQSAPFAFRFVVTPGTPSGLRIVNSR